jgi:predicted ribosomally synthesized peptide with SipW-like signal peptide
MATIFIISIFALAGLGMAYASWSDIITINGTVTTGNLCWQFTSARILDDDQPINPGGDYPTTDPDYTCNPGFIPDPIQGDFWNVEKNVGWGTIQRQDLNGDGFYETLEVTLNNVYPCYFNEFGFYIRNCGTIPLKFNHIVITDGTDETYIVTSGTPIITMDLNDNNQSDFELWWNDNDFGEQLEPGERLEEQSIWIHVLQDEDPTIQNSALHFYITLTAVQWNEYPYPPPQ